MQDIEKFLKGRKIVGLVKNRFKTGRKHHPYTTDPRILLDDGSHLSFSVVETESSEYGIEINIHKA